MRKNILYIHTHDSGRFLEPFGVPVKTPNLMELAKEGTLFRQAYCAAPTCSPSRVGLLSGQSPHSTNMLGLAQRGFKMDCYDTHLSNFLRNHGYHTCLFGVQHEAPDADMLGYDYWFDEECHHSEFIRRDTAACSHAAEYLLNYKEEKPFFMSVGFINTHRKYPEAPADFVNPDYVKPPMTIPDTKENRKDMADYMYSAKIADDSVGVVLEALRRSGREDDTIIIFTTDHGIAFPFMKCNCYDTGIGVTLIMKFAGNQAAGTVSDSLISQIDIYPTLCDMLGLEKPDYLQGRSFISLFENPELEINDEVFAEVTYHAAYEPMRCIRTSRYKLIRYFDYHNGYVPANIDASPSKERMIGNGLLKQVREREMLFDLELDPMERKNLVNSDSYKEIYDDLRLRMENWMERTHDPLLHVGCRVPKPEGAWVNRLQDLDPSCTLSE